MTVVDARLDHLAIATEFAAAPEQWPVAPRFNPVDRWYHRLHVADDHEVWLLTWLPGQGTEWHDHGGSAGAFILVQGALTELTATVAPDRPPRISPAARRLTVGALRPFGAKHVHRVTNHELEPAVSLHVYSPALVEMNQYRAQGDRLEVVASQLEGVNW